MEEAKITFFFIFIPFPRGVKDWMDSQEMPQKRRKKVHKNLHLLLQCFLAFV